MANFPTLSYGQLTMNGFSHTDALPTQVVRFLTGDEQRWISGPPRTSEMEIVLTEISQADLSTVYAFWLSSKGAANTTWQITIDGVTYSGMSFTGDDFAPTLVPGDLWTLTLKAKQNLS